MEPAASPQPTNYTHTQPTPEDIAKALQTAKSGKLVGNSSAIPIAQPAPANARQSGDQPHHHTIKALINIIILLTIIAITIYAISRTMNIAPLTGTSLLK